MTVSRYNDNTKLFAGLLQEINQLIMDCRQLVAAIKVNEAKLPKEIVQQANFLLSFHRRDEQLVHELLGQQILSSWASLSLEQKNIYANLTAIPAKSDANNLNNCNNDQNILRTTNLQQADNKEEKASTEIAANLIKHHARTNRFKKGIQLVMDNWLNLGLCEGYLHSPVLIKQYEGYVSGQVMDKLAFEPAEVLQARMTEETRQIVRTCYQSLYSVLPLVQESWGKKHADRLRVLFKERIVLYMIEAEKISSISGGFFQCIHSKEDELNVQVFPFISIDDEKEDALERLIERLNNTLSSKIVDQELKDCLGRAIGEQFKKAPLLAQHFKLSRDGNIKQIEKKSPFAGTFKEGISGLIYASQELSAEENRLKSRKVALIALQKELQECNALFEREQVRHENAMSTLCDVGTLYAYFEKFRIYMVGKLLERLSAGSREAKRDIQVPLSPSSSALVCPPTADGLGRPASAASDDAAPTNGSTAVRAGCFARQPLPFEGSSSSMMSSEEERVVDLPENQNKELQPQTSIVSQEEQKLEEKVEVEVEKPTIEVEKTKVDVQKAADVSFEDMQPQFIWENKDVPVEESLYHTVLGDSYQRVFEEQNYLNVINLEVESAWQKFAAFMNKFTYFHLRRCVGGAADAAELLQKMKTMHYLEVKETLENDRTKDLRCLEQQVSRSWLGGPLLKALNKYAVVSVLKEIIEQPHHINRIPHFEALLKKPTTQSALQQSSFSYKRSPSADLYDHLQHRLSQYEQVDVNDRINIQDEYDVDCNSYQVECKKYLRHIEDQILEAAKRSGVDINILPGIKQAYLAVNISNRLALNDGALIFDAQVKIGGIDKQKNHTLAVALEKYAVVTYLQLMTRGPGTGQVKRTAFETALENRRLQKILFQHHDNCLTRFLKACQIIKNKICSRSSSASSLNEYGTFFSRKSRGEQLADNLKTIKRRRLAP